MQWSSGLIRDSTDLHDTVEGVDWADIHVNDVTDMVIAVADPLTVRVIPKLGIKWSRQLWCRSGIDQQCIVCISASVSTEIDVRYGVDRKSINRRSWKSVVPISSQQRWLRYQLPRYQPRLLLKCFHVNDGARFPDTSAEPSVGLYHKKFKQPVRIFRTFRKPKKASNIAVFDLPRESVRS